MRSPFGDRMYRQMDGKRKGILSIEECRWITAGFLTVFQQRNTMQWTNLSILVPMPIFGSNLITLIIVTIEKKGNGKSSTI